MNQARRFPAARITRRPLLKLTGLAVTVIAAAFPSACSRNSGERAPQPVAVAVDTVRTRDVPVEIHGIGTVEAFNTVSVKARVGGELERVYFREGQDVQKGERLFLIDQAPYQAALRQAAANLARDTVTARNARAEVERYRDLAAQNYVTQQQYDSMLATAEALRATVKADSALLQNARLNLGYCLITAPISGRSGTRLVDEGNIVRANIEQPLLVINQIKPIYVSFSFPERYLTDIFRYSARDSIVIRAFPPDEDSNPHYGRLSFIDNSVDITTGTIRMKAVFANEDKQLWPGEFVNVIMVVHTLENALVVPDQAIQTGQQGDYVYAVNSDMTVDMRPVKVEIRNVDLSVIGEGLRAGDIVVTDGHLRLYPGAAVAVSAVPLNAGQATGR